MKDAKTKILVITLLSVAVVMAGVFIIVSAVSSNRDNSSSDGYSTPTEYGDYAGYTPTEYTDASMLSDLELAVKRVKLTENNASKGTVTFEDTQGQVELPDIDKSYPYTLSPERADIQVEIFSSPEKAGTGTDGWLVDLAREFNATNPTVNGRSVNIAIRSMSSGPQLEYITSGVYVPDAISPSASMWAEMLSAYGIHYQVITDKTVGNVAGILLDKDTYASLVEEYGEASINAVAQATILGKITTGYTNPFASTTGLNFLASALVSFDSANPLSSTAVESFNKFQANVPFVAYNTLQMRTAAESGTFDCMVNEYQQYQNDATLKNNYEFIPYGIRHDNPIYAVGDISQEKVEALKLFAKYLKSSAAIEQATEYGFNGLDSYKYTGPTIDGSTWVQMQKLWKQNKNTARPIAAVFVLDCSGSMSGTPMTMLKSSMLNSMKYINSTNYIGVVSYSSNINIEVPIAQFDINQQAYFNGAITTLQPHGQTASYSAVAQAILMLQNFMKDTPNVQPMVFLLSDGEQNSGASLDDIRDAIAYSDVPIYTIGYNANLAELKSLSIINEAASINADNDDVVYQLKNLFNANL